MQQSQVNRVINLKQKDQTKRKRYSEKLTIITVSETYKTIKDTVYKAHDNI